MSDTKDAILDIYLREYERLKIEQVQRIGFRDNLLYVTIITLGGILSFTLSSASHAAALLLVPWVCLILGSTYLFNDQKISAIGEYIRHDLADAVTEAAATTEPQSFFGWEIAHRTDSARIRRKWQQLIIDEMTFILSGFVALAAYWVSPARFSDLYILCVFEALLLLVLAFEILYYADLFRGK